MRIAIGADHGGYPLNERIIEVLRDAGHELTDFGTHDGSKPDDYPDVEAARRTDQAKAAEAADAQKAGDTTSGSAQPATNSGSGAPSSPATTPPSDSTQPN